MASNKFYPEKIRRELSNWMMTVAQNFLQDVQLVCKSLTKSKPDAEKFYSSFYASFFVKASRYFTALQPQISTLATKLANTILHKATKLSALQPQISTLLATKLANTILQEATKPKVKSTGNSNTWLHLSEKEIAGLQYFGGHICSNQYKKVRNSSNVKNASNLWPFSRQLSLKLLMTAKNWSPP